MSFFSFGPIVTVKNPLGIVVSQGTQIIKFTGGVSVSLVGNETIVNIIPGAIVGTPNRVSFFNALGNLSDSADLLYDDTAKLFQLNGQFGIDVAPQAKFQSTATPLTGSYVSPLSGFVFASMDVGYQTIQDFDVIFGESSRANSDATFNDPGLRAKFCANSSNQVGGGASTAFGYSNQVFSAIGFVCGYDNFMTGQQGFAANQGHQILHENASCFGISNVTARNNSFICGEFSLAQADEIFVVGNGTGVGTENNAFSVREDGEAQIDFGISINEANTRMGIATLVAGTLTIPNTVVTANSRIFLTIQNPSANVGFVYISARNPGVDFTIQSSNALDTSDVAYLIMEPL